MPDPPETLEPEALAHWRRLAPQLHAAQLLTELDVDLLAIYCELVVTKDAARELLRAGVLTRGRAGELVTNPAWRIYRDAVDRLRLLAHELGMSPSARSTIRLLPPSIGGDVKSDAP